MDDGLTPRMKQIHEFLRLLGMAVNTPGQSCEIELGRFVAANWPLFEDMITSMSTTVGNHRKFYEWLTEYGLWEKP